jgi:hypothetical protein
MKTTMSLDLLRAARMCGLRPDGRGVYQLQLFYCVFKMIGRVASVESLQRSIEDGVAKHGTWIRPPGTTAVYALTELGYRQSQKHFGSQPALMPFLRPEEISFTMTSPALGGATMRIEQAGGQWFPYIDDRQVSGIEACEWIGRWTGTEPRKTGGTATRQAFNFGLKQGWGLEWHGVWLDAAPDGRNHATIQPANGNPEVVLPDDVEPRETGRMMLDASPLNIGVTYRLADENPAVRERDPFAVDPEKVDRGNRGHAMTQNNLARFLGMHGIEAWSPGSESRSPGSDKRDFDIAWERDGTVFVGEVKSITASNEEKQLRLGLGQVLRYRQALAVGGRRVIAVLVPERQPNDTSWLKLCQDLRVVLVWPGAFEPVLAPVT